MRVAFPHFGQSVDFDVSMTFLRSAVFAIFAIGKSPFGAVRLDLLWRGMGNQDRLRLTGLLPGNHPGSFSLPEPGSPARTHKAVFTFVLPVLLVSNVPTRVLADTLKSWHSWALLLGVGLAWALISEWFWRYSLRRYTSAST